MRSNSLAIGLQSTRLVLVTKVLVNDAVKVRALWCSYKLLFYRPRHHACAQEYDPSTTAMHIVSRTQLSGI